MELTTWKAGKGMLAAGVVVQDEAPASSVESRAIGLPTALGLLRSSPLPR